MVDLRKLVGKLDPAERMKERFNIQDGFFGFFVDLLFGFVMAGLVYFVVMPLVLGANPPAVVVSSCSMTGALNVGDIMILHGASRDDINAPLVALNSSEIDMDFLPSPARDGGGTMLFSNGTPSALNVSKNGDIVVYISKLTGIQIIHRVVAKLKLPDGTYYYLTKGDSNFLPDASKNEFSCDNVITKPGGYRECVNPVQHGICKVSQDTGCLATPVREDEIIGRGILNIPLIGHVKLLFTHVLTLGHGYVDGFWC